MIKNIILATIFILCPSACSGTDVAWTDIVGLGGGEAVEFEDVEVVGDVVESYEESYADGIAEGIPWEIDTSTGNQGTDEGEQGTSEYINPNDTVVSIPVTFPKEDEECDPALWRDDQILALRVDSERGEVMRLDQRKIVSTHLVRRLRELQRNQEDEIEIYQCVYDEFENAHFWEIIAVHQLQTLM